MSRESQRQRLVADLQGTWIFENYPPASEAMADWLLTHGWINIETLTDSECEAAATVAGESLTSVRASENVAEILRAALRRASAE